VHFSTPRALEYLRPLVLGDDSLHLDQKSIFGTLSDGMLDEVYLHAALREVLQNHLLMYVAPRKPVRAVDEHAVE
jgi:hypothetical protein